MTAEEYQRAIVTISKETAGSLPAADYQGDIIVVDSLEKLPSAVEELKKAPIIGFDTETRPSFRKGQQFNVALIQLATPSCCFLFRTNLIGYPKELIDILEDPDKLKVGLSIHDDFHNLRRVAEIEPQGFIDLQNYVKEFKIADCSLTRVYGILFGRRISKGQRLTNWEAQELSELQQGYAALDAAACIDIYEFLKGGKFNPQTSPYLTLPPEPETQSPEA
ncbi:MAG: 3'-5' exonuclease domain-containing protein 2 [Muribaculaceae bacterium]|nr:3'-5' exonuclease domain-containing protein 2 [Muribaculaceae bacterium]